MSSEKKQFAAQFSHDPEHLDKLADSITSKEHHVYTNIVNNPSVHHKTLHKIATKVMNQPFHESLLANIASRSIHPHTLDMLATHKHWYVASEVASNPSTRPDTLHKLATHYAGNNPTTVHEAIVRHHKVRTDTLDKLSSMYAHNSAIGNLARREIKERNGQ